MSSKPTKVLMLCSGIGREVRGIETFFADVFAGIRQQPDLDVTLGIGAGPPGECQETITSLSRNGSVVRRLGSMIGRDGYALEQISSIPSVLAKIQRLKPDVIYSSEANLAMRLMSLRRLTGAHYRFVYSNGAPIRGPFPWADVVHQVTPTYRDHAIADGDDPQRHWLLPYGFSISDNPPDRSPEKRREARRLLGLPEGRPVILSVGWIARRHKRMDYVAKEIAKLPKPRPLFAMIGAIDENSSEIIAEAKQLLGDDGVVARSVPPQEVQTWYAAADVFVLGSLAEGFGRVYIEALAAGLPVLCHDYPVGRYVNGDSAAYGDFSKEGALAALLAQSPALFDYDPEADRKRWSYARDNFSWSKLAPEYARMLVAAARSPQRAKSR